MLAVERRRVLVAPRLLVLDGQQVDEVAVVGILLMAASSSATLADRRPVERRHRRPEQGFAGGEEPRSRSPARDPTATATSRRRNGHSFFDDGHVERTGGPATTRAASRIPGSWPRAGRGAPPESQGDGGAPRRTHRLLEVVTQQRAVADEHREAEDGDHGERDEQGHGQQKRQARHRAPKGGKAREHSARDVADGGDEAERALLRLEPGRRPKCASGRFGSRASRAPERLLRAFASPFSRRSCPWATRARAIVSRFSTFRSMRSRRISAKVRRAFSLSPARSAFR